MKKRWFILFVSLCMSVTFLFYGTLMIHAEEKRIEEPIKIQRKKPSGRWCGKDDFTPGSDREVKYFKPDKEFAYENKQSLNPAAFDRFKYKRETKLCFVPFTVAEYVNQSKVEATYQFSETAEKSTTYNVSVDAGFHEAFKATMGYSASNTVKRSVSFSVTLKPNQKVTLQAAPSIMAIEGTWSYLTGRKEVTVYYPTYLTWITK